jgi:digeranylgeranylglycerophospholipid reductase
MIKEHYDVVVVGCGPGGATAGRFAVAGGATTLIVDRKRDIGLPIHDFNSVLYSLSEAEEIAQVNIDRKCVACRMEEVELFSPSGKHGGGQPWPEEGCAIYRNVFEKDLTIEAVRAGADIMINSRVVGLVKENGAVKGVRVRSGPDLKTIGCSVVIGADGAYGGVAHWAGMPVIKECIVNLGYEFIGVRPLQPPRQTYELYLGGFSPGFIATVNPRGNDRFHIGVHLRPDVGTTRISLRDLLKTFMNHLETLKRYNFDKAYAVSMISGSTTSVFGEIAQKIISDGVLLIGDAAWRPLIGTRWGAAGILNAIYTGRFAGETAATAIKEGDVSEKSLSRYLDKIEATLAGQRPQIAEAREYFLKLVLSSPEEQDRAIEAVGKHLSSLWLHFRGALSLSDCMEPIKTWYGKE